METQVKLSKPLKFNPLKLFWISIVLLTPIRAQANPLVQFWQNRSLSRPGLLLEPRVSFYHTSANFDQNSQSVALPNSASLTKFYYDLNVDDALADDWFVFGRLSVFSDQLLGVAHRLVSDPRGFRFSLQFDAVWGDPSIDLTGGAFAEWALNHSTEWSIEAGAGYTGRSRGYSSALPYRLIVKRDPSVRGFLFSAGVRGQYSLQTDSTDRATEAAEQLRDADGSAIIGAVNPAWTLAQVRFGFRTTADTAFYALMAAPLTGKNTASGWQLSLGMQWRLGARTEKSSPPETAVAPSPIRVTGVNDALYLVRINQGSKGGIEKGQLFDIAQRKSMIPVGRARVSDVKDDEAVLNMVEFYQDQGIEKGFVARRVVQ